MGEFFHNLRGKQLETIISLSEQEAAEADAGILAGPDCPGRPEFPALLL